ASPSRTASRRTTPATGATIGCSIFIASTTTRVCPACTASPSATSTRTTVPGIAANAEITEPLLAPRALWRAPFRRGKASGPQPVSARAARSARRSFGDCGRPARVAAAARHRLELLLDEQHALQELRLAPLQVRDAELVLQVHLVVVLGEELALRL